MMNTSFTSETIKSYIKLRKKEIDLFKSSKISNKKGITDWEKINTLDC